LLPFDTEDLRASILEELKAELEWEHKMSELTTGMVLETIKS
jgi:hypothetical protein